MKDILIKLDHQLSALRPEYYQMLKEPLNIRRIYYLQKKYKVKVPADIKALYKWKNGQLEDCYDAFVNNAMFIPLSEALETAAEFTAMIGSDFDQENWWHNQWIPLFHNGGGDYICYDCGGLFTGQAGQLIVFRHDVPDRHVIAPTLSSFVSKLTEFYDTNVPAYFDEYFHIGNIPGFPKKFFAG